MKFNWKGIIIWFLVFDFIHDPLRDLIIKGSTDYFDISNLQDVMILLSGNVSFFLYGLIPYVGLYCYYPRKKHWVWILCIVFAFVLPVIFRYAIEQVLYDWIFGFVNYRRGYPIKAYFTDNMYFAFRYVIFGVVYYFIQLSFYRGMKEKQLTIENQKMSLSLLRNQINPHFLLNSLNNIYSLIFHKSDHSLKAVETLSGLLKHSLYERNETVTINHELDIVEKVIYLSKLRFDYPIKIDYEVDDHLMSKKIPPFIIVPLIENAFKHGSFKGDSDLLEVKVSDEDGELIISTCNTIGHHEKDTTGGIGLINIEKRLDLIYGHKHQMKVWQQGDRFYVKIKLPLA